MSGCLKFEKDRMKKKGYTMLVNSQKKDGNSFALTKKHSKLKKFVKKAARKGLQKRKCHDNSDSSNSDDK